MAMPYTLTMRVAIGTRRTGMAPVPPVTMTLEFADDEESCLFYRPLVEQTACPELSERVMAFLKEVSDRILLLERKTGRPW